MYKLNKMEIIEVSRKEFNNIILDPYHIFGHGNFADLNKDKVGSIHYLLFKDGKYRFGLTSGIRNNSLQSPFSSPYGGFVFLRDNVKFEYFDKAVLALIDWANSKCLTSINITLPPTLYHESFISKQTNVLFRSRFEIKKVEMNYALNLLEFEENYISKIWRNARRNLKIAISSNLLFKRCISLEEKKTAYNIITLNRKFRGFPLKMSWKEIEETSNIVPIDFFMLSNSKHQCIASAIAFHVSNNVVQIIYWGDLHEFARLKTMNYLAYKIFEFYKQQGVKVVDLGPATENSIPNLGLCDFKESIGCDITMKYSFKLNL